MLLNRCFYHFFFSWHVVAMAKMCIFIHILIHFFLNTILIVCVLWGVVLSILIGTSFCCNCLDAWLLRTRGIILYISYFITSASTNTCTRSIITSSLPLAWWQNIPTGLKPWVRKIRVMYKSLDSHHKLLVVDVTWRFSTLVLL